MIVYPLHGLRKSCGGFFDEYLEVIQILCIFAAETNINHTTMTTNETRKKYVKPAMQVYDLPKSVRLLASSGDGGLDPLNPFNPGPSDPLNP